MDLPLRDSPEPGVLTAHNALLLLAQVGHAVCQSWTGGLASFWMIITSAPCIQVINVHVLSHEWFSPFFTLFYFDNLLDNLFFFFFSYRYASELKKNSDM